MKLVPPDRVRDVVDAVLEVLDQGLDRRARAARAMLGPFHFHRLVRAGIGEAPAAFRRRTVTDVLREVGVRDVETRDPIEWERAMAARSWPARGARVEHRAIERAVQPLRLLGHAVPGTSVQKPSFSDRQSMAMC
jgi:hypothetical protein